MFWGIISIQVVVKIMRVDEIVNEECGGLGENVLRVERWKY